MTDPEENPTSSLRQVDDPVVFSPHDSASAPPVEIDAEACLVVQTCRLHRAEADCRVQTEHRN
jgi:hypothetical protein